MNGKFKRSELKDYLLNINKKLSDDNEIK